MARIASRKDSREILTSMAYTSFLRNWSINPSEFLRITLVEGVPVHIELSDWYKSTKIRRSKKVFENVVKRLRAPAFPSLLDQQKCKTTALLWERHQQSLYESCLRLLSYSSLAMPIRSDTSSARARTALGQRLREIRDSIKASGEKLLTWQEIDAEVEERRGE